MEQKQKQTFDSDQRREDIKDKSEAHVEAVGALASEFHEDWRKTRLDLDGNFEPRIKSTKDEVWIAAHGTNEVDIANSTYAELPEDWQAENKAAAEVIVDIIDDADGLLSLEDPEVRNIVGERIHAAWLSRNEWAKGGELDVPFADLPIDEQNKDLNQLIVAQRLFSNE